VGGDSSLGDVAPDGPTINGSAGWTNPLKEKDPTLTDDAREALTLVISTNVPEPRFEGQTKTQLSNGEGDAPVQKFLGHDCE
jgi:DNA gyrase subunit B